LRTITSFRIKSAKENHGKPFVLNFDIEEPPSSATTTTTATSTTTSTSVTSSDASQPTPYSKIIGFKSLRNSNYSVQLLSFPLRPNDGQLMWPQDGEIRINGTNLTLPKPLKVLQNTHTLLMG
jgi:hypothetical protein